jgi:putative nucleotidyltransferase with HDIG domain
MKSSNWLPDWLYNSLIKASSGFQVWLVGGAVRNTLLGIETIDFDFAVKDNARNLARLVANSLGGYYYELDSDRDTGRVILPQEDQSRLFLDFARLSGGGIGEDLRERDFTINALAVDLLQPEKVIDTTGGLQDLKDKVLRLCSPDSILADPIRGLRAVRLAVRFGLIIEPDALRAIRIGAGYLSNMSPERIRDEFLRLMDLPLPGKAIRLMDHLWLVSVLFPHLDSLRDLTQSPPHEFSAWDHTLVVLDHLGKLLTALNRNYDPENATELLMGEVVYRLGRFREEMNRYLERELSHGRQIRRLLFFGALYHDVGKPGCYELADGQVHFHGHEVVGAEIIAREAKDLKLSNSEIHWLRILVRNHLRPSQLERETTISQRAIFRFIRDTGEVGVGVILLSLADLLGQQTPPMDQEKLSKRVEIARQLLTAIFEASPKRYRPDPLLRGDEIARALGIEPGPEIGRLLKGLQEAQAIGEVTSKTEAYEFIRWMYKQSPGMDGSDSQ